jgi:hypothetical protein
MAKTPAQRAAKHGDKAALPTTAVVNSRVNPRPGAAPAKQGNANLIVIVGAVATVFLFWYFHLLTLNQMTQLSGGLSMPDSVVFGFGMDHVEALRKTMNADALGQLQYVHKTAGTLFPLIFAFTSLLLTGLNVAKKPLRWALWALPVLFAVVQIWANVAVDQMLDAATVTSGQVALASTLVVLSWLLMFLTLAGAGVALLIGRKAKTPPAEA